MRCPSCGARLEVVEAFCPNCDRPLDIHQLREERQAVLASEQKRATPAIDSSIHPQEWADLWQNEHWKVHWVYSEEEWQQYVATEWQRAKRDLRMNPLLFLGLLLLSGVLLAIAGTPGSTIALLEVGLLVVGVLATWGASALQRAIHRENQQRPTETTITPDGIDFASAYTPLERLLDVEVQAGDPCYLCYKYKGRKGPLFGKVLVPQGHEEEAQQVVKRLEHHLRERTSRHHSPLTSR